MHTLARTGVSEHAWLLLLQKNAVVAIRPTVDHLR